MTALREQILQSLCNLMLYMAIAETVVLVIIVVFFKEKEEELAPSIDAVGKDGSGRSMSLASTTSYKPEMVSGSMAQLKELMRNGNYLRLMFGSSLLISCTYSFPTVMEQIIEPFNYSSDDASNYGALWNLFGIIGGIIVVFILNWKPAFKMVTIVITLLTIITFGLLKFNLSVDEAI